MRFVIDLKVRKSPPIKSLRHRSTLCGDSRPRLSGGAKLRLALIVVLGNFRPSNRFSWQFLREKPFPISGIEAMSEQGELRSPGQPRAAVPTCLSVSVAALNNSYSSSFFYRLEVSGHDVRSTEPPVLSCVQFDPTDALSS